MKLPVFKAFGATIAYLFKHAPTLFAAMWLPALLLIAGTAYAMPQYMESMMAFSAADPAAGLPEFPPEFFRSMGIMMGAASLFYPMLTVASLRHLVRGDELKAPFYLGFGGDEIRVIAAYLLFMLMFVAVYIVFILGFLVVTLVFSLLSKEIGGAIALAGFFAGFIALFWFFLRLSLIFPAAIATRKIGIVESWRATKGSSFRLLGFWALIILIFAFIGGAYFVLALPGMIEVYSGLFEAGADPAAQREIERRMLELQRDIYDPSKPGFWPFIAGTYVYTLAITAIVNVASGTAWRYLTDRERPRGESATHSLAA